MVLLQLVSNGCAVCFFELYGKINSFFISFGFELCSADSNLYVLSQDGLMCVVILYVDDLLITSSFEAKRELLRNELKATF